MNDRCIQRGCDGVRAAGNTRFCAGHAMMEEVCIPFAETPIQSGCFAEPFSANYRPDGTPRRYVYDGFEYFEVSDEEYQKARPARCLT